MPVKKTVPRKVAPAKKMAKVSKGKSCCSEGSSKSGSCCSDESCCCTDGSGKKCHFAVLVAAIIVVVVAIGYFAYTQHERSKMPYNVSEENGVTVVNPGDGLVPDGPPNITPPTTPPPKETSAKVKQGQPVKVK